jgi:hypothetical protein
MSEEDAIQKRFFVAPLMRDGKPALHIRRIFTDDAEIKELIDTIFANGSIEIKAVIKFRDPFQAKIRLKEIGLLE